MKFLLFTAVCLALNVGISAIDVAIKNEDGTSPQYCILFEGNVTGSIEYEVENSTKTFNFEVDENSVNVSGTCVDVQQNVSVQAFSVDFLPKGAPVNVQQWKLSVQFAHDEQKTFKLSALSLFSVLPEAWNSTDKTVKYVLDSADEMWDATDRNGFTCSESPFYLKQKSASPALKSTVKFEKVRVLAFARLPTPVFPKDQIFEQCNLDTKTSDVVPIVVGACLAGLVIVVLVAYLIGRARARRQGYASV
ncbi:unnamed protein product [Bursaphelenchus okinawaensis]|uniref:Lysosome-associated membrane glycoprotein 2-like transmembrane domain-containing protein n=1 Tax=Bursaphelenchus okinawaensis TaxID=465554 RepID=A0A811LRL9_9BILA|nr:unnamed protein product [Bursaphelenchus okinawaensis]CAG9128409.1 unnamed protein product [Bursaphelenchus okinawaensis]